MQHRTANADERRVLKSGEQEELIGRIRKPLETVFRARIAVTKDRNQIPAIDGRALATPLIYSIKGAFGLAFYRDDLVIQLRRGSDSVTIFDDLTLSARTHYE